MKYLVKMFANHENSDYSDYSQMLRAESGHEYWAYWYDPFNTNDSDYCHLVIEKYVEAETGSGAIIKLKRWLNEGLSEYWLNGDPGNDHEVFGNNKYTFGSGLEYEYGKSK